MGKSSEMYGPWPAEPPAGRLGPVDRVAVLADVHANVPALAAVLGDVMRAGADLLIFAGDLTWGPEPEHTVSIVQELRRPVVFLRGNRDREVVEIARYGRDPADERQAWMAARHSAASVGFLAAFPFSAVVEITGLGAVRLCHGSPRSDIELVTPVTPAHRLVALAGGFDEAVLVTAHSHLQFDRTVAGLRSVNPGSVGLPYHDGPPGEAHWLLLGPGVSHRRTRYDAAEAISRAGRVGDPGADSVVGQLTLPPGYAANSARLEALGSTG